MLGFSCRAGPRRFPEGGERQSGPDYAADLEFADALTASYYYQMKSTQPRSFFYLWALCTGLWIGQSDLLLWAAKDAPVRRTGPLPRSEVVRLLFEADVLQKLEAFEQARALYRKADSSGSCPEQLVAAYVASSGQGERLFLDMEAARKGDMRALRASLDRLYLDRRDSFGDPSLALELFNAAKKANPKGSIEGEAEVAELLKMAVASGPFDMEAFLNSDNLADWRQRAAASPESEGGPSFFLWELAEEASVGGRFGRPDPQLALQLAARAAGSLGERLSAVRAAHANWNGNATAKFEYRKHLPSLEGAQQAEKDRAGRSEWEYHRELKEREFEARYKRTEAVFKDPRALNVNLNAAPGVVSSEDGRLRIISWDTELGGTMHLYCTMAQFKSPDGRAGFALLGYPGEWENADLGKLPPVSSLVGKIDTITTGAKESVYLVWSQGQGSTRGFGECVAAVTLKNGKVEKAPFFKTKRALLSDIQFAYTVSDDGDSPSFQFKKENGPTLLVPIISDRDDFSGKFFKYVFDGKWFVYSGVEAK